MKIYVTLFVLFFIGCNRPVPLDWTGTVRVRPIIVQNNKNETPWTRAQISADFDKANLYWKNIGIQFHVLEPERIISEDLYDSDGLLDFGKVVLRSRKLAQEQKAYPVFFVNKITWRGASAAGVSTSADAPFGFQYGTSIAGIGTSHGLTLAHELGHAWNLRHTWSDKHKDTPSKNRSDCNSDIKCNVMSYCFPGLDCVPLWTAEQIVEIRKWALRSSRRDLMTTIPEIVTMEIQSFRLADKFEPIVD